MKNIVSVISKEVLLEVKTRALFYSLSLFVVVIVLIIAFVFPERMISPELYISFLLLTIFFLSIHSGLRSFLSEYDRGTALFLLTTTHGSAIFWGKVLYNAIIVLFMSTLSIVLFNIIYDVHITFEKNLALIYISSLIGAMTPIFSLLLSKSKMGGALFPILLFPLYVPIILLSLKILDLSTEKSVALRYLVLLTSYVGILLTVSFLFFDQIRRE